mmetsp:Transcript_3674/g.5211  ORF Transcript_3674/g.5211 Transcript_3674/m.5211 type:complete len:751 (-) Transcript_3674:123-2375(-)
MMRTGFISWPIIHWRRRILQKTTMDNRAMIATGAAVGIAAVITARALTGAGSQFEPPILDKREHQVAFGYVEDENRGENPMNPPVFREDPYFWVRDDARKNKEVIKHLEKENAYTEFKMKPLKKYTDSLYKELLSHVQETDSSVPYKHGPYEYYTKTVEGSSYKIHCRRELGSEKEEIILDENVLAKGKKHCDVGAVEVSPSHQLMAYSVDSTGYETYEVFIVNIGTGKVVDQALSETAGRLTWGRDDKHLYYSTFDQAHRVDKVWRHTQGETKDSDILLFEEDDELFSAGFQKTRSERFLFIGSQSSETSEGYMLDLTKESTEAELIAGREKGVLYDVNEYRGKLYIITNKDDAKNFKLMSTSVDQPGPENWKEVMPYDKDIKLDLLSSFKDFAVLYGRQGGFTQMWIVRGDDDDLTRVEFEEKAYTVAPGVNEEFETTAYRFSYSSLTTPLQTVEMNIESGERKVLKEQPVPNFDRSSYESDRIEVTVEDGTKVPMSLVYKKGLLNGHDPKPCYLYGYGSYEISIDPFFNSKLLPFLDRDVVVAIAHIRGGGEMGRMHYENAKYLKKKNTFTDFIACADELVTKKITSPDRLVIEGRSAGGLLIGAVINMRPDLFHAAHAGVPFVDVMNTMSDATIPLTTGEWEEWGNPNEEKYFDYMLSYSPYDNVKKANYPALLATSGLWDPRVAYWEPTKWLAKLRENNLGEGDMLLKMDLASGHFSASDRYKLYRERAFELTFLLDQLKVLRTD